MKNEKWKYKVGGRARGIIPSLFLAVLFGGVSIYLYLDKQGIFLFSLFLTVIALVLVFVCIFQAKFVKVLIGENGIYYQTKPGNGRFAAYREISEAWESSGESLNGMEQHFVNYRTADGRVVRFPFYPYESEGVHYLIKCVREGGAGILSPDTDEGCKAYIIDGKIYGKTSIVVCIALLALMLAITVPLISDVRGRGLGGIMLLGGIGTALIILAAVIIRYLCFKVWIGKSGFYFRSGPFNGRFYQYRDIAGCKIEKKVYKHYSRFYSGPGRQLYYYYFIFTDKSGRIRKFQFQQPIYGHEVETLKKRIDQAARISRKRRKTRKSSV